MFVVDKVTTALDIVDFDGIWCVSLFKTFAKSFGEDVGMFARDEFIGVTCDNTSVFMEVKIGNLMTRRELSGSTHAFARSIMLGTGISGF